jgi:hypothetical protein
MGAGTCTKRRAPSRRAKKTNLIPKNQNVIIRSRRQSPGTAGLGRLLRGRCTPLASKVHEILLTRLKRSSIGTGGAFYVHRKPDRPDDNPNDASSDILRDLRILLRCESFSPRIVGLNFGVYHSAIALRVLWLHRGNGLRISARAGRQSQADGHRRKYLGMHCDSLEVSVHHLTTLA